MADLDRVTSLLGHLSPLYPLLSLPSRARPSRAPTTTRGSEPSPRRSGVVVLACSERDIMADGGAAWEAS
jgi:hypothetical protein